MIDFDAASLLLQWATGGLFFLWITTRHRVVSLGYGWTMRITYLCMAIGACVIGVVVLDPFLWRDIAAGLVAIATLIALVVSFTRRNAGVSGHNEETFRRSARVAHMTGIERNDIQKETSGKEFPPILDLYPVLFGLLGVVASGIHAGSPVWLSIARFVIGSFFLGAITDAMLLGHWYLVQPGLARGPLLELVRWVGVLWLPECIVFLIPTGMFSVFTGAIDDGYNGLLGWFWIACAVTTLGLVVVTRLALKERAYSAVMAATGLLYLGILTGFGMDLVARALLS